MKSEYPKTVYIQRTTVATGETSDLDVTFKNMRDEMEFWQQAAAQEPNFTYKIIS